MRVVGSLCAEAHNNLSQIIRPGISTLELDRLTEEFFRSHGATTLKGYKDYPYNICTAVNDEVIHCVPTNYVLKDGDIITIDLGAKLDGFWGDTAKTYLVGNVAPEIKLFLERGYDSLMAGIEKAVVGNMVSEITKAIGKSAKAHGYGLVPKYGGHGIGHDIHEEPFVPNVPNDKKDAVLVSGMVICIEPILTLYPSGQIKENGPWELKTVDGTPACHWEHTVAITDNGPEILTLRTEEQSNERTGDGRA